MPDDETLLNAGVMTHAEEVRAAATGDDEALRRLVRLYQGRVYRFGRRVCRDGFDADDAVQDAFVKLARRPEVMRDPGVVGWLFTTVKNACLRLARSFSRRVTLAEELREAAADAPMATPEEAVARWRIVERVHRALATLDADHRAVVVLRDLEGLPGDVVAEQLGLSEAAMKSRLHRGRRSIRAAIEADRESENGDADVRQ